MADRRAGGDLSAARGAIAALRRRGPRVVVAKSLMLEDTPADALDMLAGDEAGFWRLRTPKLPIAVNGAGDLFAALFFHHWLERRATGEALSLAASSVHAIVTATETAGSRELAVVAAQDELVRPSRTLCRRGGVTRRRSFTFFAYRRMIRTEFWRIIGRRKGERS